VAHPKDERAAPGGRTAPLDLETPMRLGSIASRVLALCLAFAPALAAGSVECDAERGVCWKRGDGKIQRTVKEITGGIAAEITSPDPKVAAQIGRDFAELADRLEKGQPAQTSDPLFAAIAQHRSEIALTVVEIEGGVSLTASSKNPKVTALIRQHATKRGEGAAAASPKS
jgi:hypothetical protein